jgi:protein SCO1/2
MATNTQQLTQKKPGSRTSVHPSGERSKQQSKSAQRRLASDMPSTSSAPAAVGTKRRAPNGFLLSIIGFAVAVLIAILLHREPGHSPAFFGHSISPVKQAYDFHFANEMGVEKRLSQWRGKVVLFFFGFTHCPNICPTTLMNLGEVYNTLARADRDQVRFVFISVDPRRDTPAQLRNYLSYFDLPFVGLTGSKEEIDRATGAFGASYAFVHKPGDPADDYNVMHSASVYVVNPMGEWELIYGTEQLQHAANVATDIESILHR